MTDSEHISAAGYASPSERGGDAAAVDASPPRVGIQAQIDEVAKEVRNRERYYPGRLKPETAEQKLRDMRAALETLEFIGRHAEGLRHLISVLQRVARYGSASDNAPVTEDEAELLLQHPAVAAVMKEFPEARIAAIRALEQ